MLNPFARVTKSNEPFLVGICRKLCTTMKINFDARISGAVGNHFYRGIGHFTWSCRCHCRSVGLFLPHVLCFRKFGPVQFRLLINSIHKRTSDSIIQNKNLKVCALHSLLGAPNWRPRFKYYHWLIINDQTKILQTYCQVAFAHWSFFMLFHNVCIMLVLCLDCMWPDRSHL